MTLVYYLDSKQTELYDLATDPAESNDLSTDQVDRTKSLREELLRWIAETKK